MTITPQQAREYNEQKDIRELERKIDERIKDGFDGKSVRVTAGYMNERTQREILHIYRTAGWDVKIDCDRNDHEFYIFTPRKESGGNR